MRLCNTLMQRCTRALQLLFLLACVAACTADQLAQSARLTLETKLADTLIQSGQPTDVVLTAALTEQEVDRLIFALDTYTWVREKWQAATAQPGNLATQLAALSGDYATLYGEYQAVRQIVEGHWDEYSGPQQVLLAQYHGRALAIHESVTALLANQQRAEAIAGMVDLGVLIAKAVVL
jgi:hypothetical protein